MNVFRQKEDPNMMNVNHDDLDTGVNGRLRPRKQSIALVQANKIIRKSERNTESKTKNYALNNINLLDESGDKPCHQFLCLYCNKKFFLKQSLSQHLRRIHFSTSGQDLTFDCNFCNHKESGNNADNAIIKHMVDFHPNQYFACHNCNTRFSSTSELASHRSTTCENEKLISVTSYHSKLRPKNITASKKEQKPNDDNIRNEESPNGTGFSGIVISCELKPSQMKDATDIENNITTNLILPRGKNLADNSLLEKNAIILLDDIQWNKSIGSHFSFRNADTEQILSRLGVVHRSPKTSECTRRDWYRIIDETTKFEKCFDTGFYSRVASNVQENLTKFLDGSFNRLPSDSDNVMKTRKAKNNVVINTVEGFPILLAAEQYSRIHIDNYCPRAIAPKHKWKWDNLENENIKNVVHEDREKRDSHTNNCIVTLVSSLDMWTQLCMRRKYEAKFNKVNIENKKIEKQNTISNELKQIIEGREIPNTSTPVVKCSSWPVQYTNKLDFPASLGLVPAVPKYDLQPAVLSGEWARPRCYVCCACGEQTRDTKALSSHISTRHPNAQIAHYEIVGEPLLNADILKHLYVPPSQVFNRTRPLRGSRECTKCKKPVSFDELHQHMLECAGDTPVVRRRCRYRPFGVRRRRPRLPDNRIRKRIRKDIRNRQNSQKTHMKSRNKLRSEVGDAETIRRMLADLPAKRHRVAVNPIDPAIRSRKIHEKRQLLLRRRVTEDPKNYRSTNTLSGSIKSIKTDGGHASNSNVQTRKKGLPLQTSLPKVLPSKRRVILKRTVKKNRAQQPANENQLTSNPETPENILKQVETNSASSGITTEDLSLSNKSDKINLNNNGDGARECSNRENGNYRDGQQSRNDEPVRNNFPQNNGPTQNAPLKHSIARLTSTDECSPKYVKYPYFMPQENYITTIHNVQYMPTGQPLFFENEIAVNKLDKPPLCDPTRKLDVYGYQKNKLNKPKKGLNDCIAMLKNKLVDTNPNQHCSASPAPNLQKENTILEEFRTEFNGNENDFASMSLLQTRAIPLAHANVPSIISTPLDLSGKSENLDSTYGTSLDLSVKSTHPTIDTYVTLDLSTKNLSQCSTTSDKKTINTDESNMSHISNDLSLNLSVKSTPKSNNSPTNTNVIDLTENSKKPIMTVDENLSKDANVTIIETKVTENSSTANNIHKEVNPVIEAFNKVSIDTDIKKSVEDKRISEKAVSKQQFTKLNEKSSNQKPIYDPTLKIPQYKIRANTDSKSIEKEVEKPEQKLTTAMEAGSCNIELLPKEIVDILGTMPVQHRNKLLNVLPQVFAKTVKQLKLAVDLNITKETITSPNKTEIATQTSNNISEQTCPPEFVNVDTDKFLIDPVTGAIIERTNTENENSECLQNEKITNLMAEDKKEEIKEELSSLKVKSDVCLDNIDPSATTANSCPIKQKPSNDQTASLRAVRIKSANEKLKSSKHDYIHSATINAKKLNFEDSNKTALKSNELKNNHMELNVKTTLAIQQFEVTSTQQNSCSYKQLSPTFVPDTLKNVSLVSGPILESRSVLDISNSDEDTNLHSNKNMNKVSSDLTLHNVQFMSPNANTIPHNKTDTEECNHQIVKNVVKSPTENVFKSDEIKTLFSSETNQAYQSSEPIIILKDIDSSLKSSVLKCSMPISTSQQNHNIGLCELDDDDPEDDVSLATILKQKMANQEKKNSSEKINNSVSRKSVKKRKGQNKVNNGNSLEKVKNHKTGSLKKNKNQMSQTKISPNTKTVSTPDEKMEAYVDNQSIIANPPIQMIDLKKRSNKKKSRFNSDMMNFHNNKQINQTGICQLNTEENKSKLATQKSNEESPFIKSSVESKENDNDNYNSLKITIGKNSQEEQVTLNNELAKKQPSFNKSNTIEVLKDENIISRKRMDKNKTDYIDSIITTPPIENDFHKVTNIVNDSRTLLSNNEGTKEKIDSKSITNENSKVSNENVDYIIKYNQINTENAVSSTNPKNEAIYKLQKSKVRTQHTIEEIIKPHNLNQSLIHAQLDVHKTDNQITNLSSIEVNTEIKESGLPKENLTRDNEKDKIASGEICLLSKLEEGSDIPLRRSRRGKSFYAESYVAGLGEHLVSDSSNLQHKTPLTKKQVIFSKLLLDEENHFKPSNDVSCSIKNDSDILNVTSDISSKAETNQSIMKPLKRKLLPVVKKKIKKKKTIEEIVQARSHVVNLEKTLNVEYIVLPLKSDITDTPELPIVAPEKDKNHDLTLDSHNKNFDDKTNDLSSKTNSQDVPEDQNCDHDIGKTNQQKSNKKKQPKNIDVLNEKEIENCANSTLENRDVKQSTCNLNENVLVPQLAIKNDHSQVTISIPRLNIDHSLSENNNKLKSEKRKPSKSDKGESDETSKKSKICKTDNIVTSQASVEVKLNSENEPANKNSLTAFDKSIAEELQIIEFQLAQNIRTKSTAEKSYSDLECDDTFYDFFDDPLGENDYTNDSTFSSCTESIDNKELNNKKKMKDKKSKKSKKNKITSAENDESSKFDHNPLTNGKEDTSSDSDDSMKSDVPLKKYVQEISKSEGESSSKAMVSNVDNINVDVKENEKEGKNKTVEINDNENVTNDAHTEEELRSEQFMESFGFFSERKPRKSNLLATKKISETFHIISNESDDMFLPAKNKSSKKPNSTESNKKSKDKEPDPGNSKILKEKNKKTLDPSTSKKPQKKRRRKRRPINSATYCLFCRKDFERLDNYLRHKITLLHISRVSEIQMQFDTIPFADMPNHLVAYKHHIYKLKKKREKMARDKKRSGRDSPIEPFVFPTLEEIINKNKPGTSKSKGKCSKGKGKKSEIKKSKVQKSEVSAIEANKSENKQEVNEEGTDKSEIKEQGGSQLETDKPGCSSENISRRGLSRDEALFLDCCELLKESHKAENLNTETSHALEEGKESFEVKSFDGASILNNDEKSWEKNEDDVDPITAKSILESEEVRNLEKDLISGLKEAVSNASSLVSSSKASKEFVSDIEDTNEITHCSKNPDIMYAKEKNTENAHYSKKIEIIYTNKELNEIPHCSKNTEVIYSNEKINENAHCSKNLKIMYSKEKANEKTHSMKNEIMYLKIKSNEISDCSKNTETANIKVKLNNVPHNSENADYLKEKSYEIAHCSKNSDIIHSKHITHSSKNAKITHSKEKINQSLYNSKSAEIMYSQEQNYEVAHCSKNANFMYLKHKNQEIGHCSKNIEGIYSKEKTIVNPQSSKNVHNIYSEQKINDTAHCPSNTEIMYSKEKLNGNSYNSKHAEIMYSQEKSNEMSHRPKNTDVIHSKRKLNETAHCSKNVDLIFSKGKNYEVTCNPKNADMVYSQEKIYDIGHCSKTAELVYAKEKTNEVLQSSKDTEVVYLKETNEIAHCSTDVEIVYSKENNSQVAHGSKNERYAYSKEKIKEVACSPKNVEPTCFKENIIEGVHNSRNADVTNAKEKKCDSTRSSKSAKFMYPKEKRNEIAHCSKNTELTHLTEINEVMDSCNNTESTFIKEKNKEELQSTCTNLGESEDAQNAKHAAQIKPNTTPETKLVDIFEDKFDIIKRKCRSQAAAAKNLERSLGIQNSNQAQKKSDKKAKSKKNSKKNIQSPIVTKGALKEFDGIKVSIPTSDIKLSVFTPVLSDSDRPPKKKKKNSSKKKKEKSDSNFNTMLNLSVPEHSKDNSGTAKQAVDVYEFMDNEDTDMFDFRSKRLDRFKNTNKDLGHCSKTDPVINKDYEISQQSSISGSDVDDFVYMSDDYVCSADETENSLLSCELGTVSKSSTEGKKNGSSIKRKDSTEKNAVMGKIFKHNAMRNERKNFSKAKEVKCAKANLDQLFDSLLENEPHSSPMLNENIGSKKEAPEPISSNVSESLPLPAIDETTSEAGLSREVAEEEESEAGVARQRARRKCTVGKQNVLVESWSSESEDDSGESEGAGAGHRRRAARPQGPSRRARRITFKTDENESRVCSDVSTSSGRRDKRSRSELAYYWSSTEEEDTRVEQHGWIVGDSHKKLVTMLAHAKGRKRDDKRHFVE